MPDETLEVVDLLAKPMAEFPDLPNLPGGKTFYGKLLGMSAGASRVKGTPLFHFDVRLTDPGKDVTDAEMKVLQDAGFSLADYNAGADFYLTANAMKMLRRFLETLGFSSGVSVKEALKLADTGEPTQESNDTIRGLDVFIKTPAADADGRVYINRVDLIAGIPADKN